MAEVILIEKNVNLFKHLTKEIENFSKKFPKKSKIAIKMHMGEYGNLSYIRPSIASAIVGVLLKAQLRPFLFDTPVAYPSPRCNSEGYLEAARKNGFSKETIGCPILISNESKITSSKFFDKLEVAKDLIESDGLIVLSHFKGHVAAGYGGAIKNLGMGGVPNKMKFRIHMNSQPLITGKCKGCKKCLTKCPVKAIKLKEGKVSIDYKKCIGCYECVNVCTNGGLKKSNLNTLLADVANSILSNFKKEKVLFVNLLLDINERCDCELSCGKHLCQDIGVIISNRIEQAEIASLNLVNKESNGVFFNQTKLDIGEVKEILNSFGPISYKIKIKK